MCDAAASLAPFSFRENGFRFEGRNDAGISSQLSEVGVGAFRCAQRHPTRVGRRSVGFTTSAVNPEP